MIGGTLQERFRLNDTSVVFNEGSIDSDFRVESNNATHALFVEGSSGNIGIGDSDPTRMLHIKALGTGAAEEATIMFENEVGTTGSIGQGDTNSNAMIFTENGSERMRIPTNGSLLHNTTATSPGQNNTTTGASILAGRFMFNNSGADNIMGRNDAGGLLSIRNGGTQVGLISVGGSSTTYATSSDYRLKENVSYSFDATSRLKQLKPARFNFIADADNTLVDGFIAHEVSSIVPEAISGKKDAMVAEVLYVDGDEIPDGKKVGDVKIASRIDPQGIDQSKLVPLLVKTIQELEARITALENA